jgi:hypothetical protein
MGEVRAQKFVLLQECPQTPGRDLALHSNFILRGEKESASKTGVPAGTRTRNLLLRRQLLYPLELQGLASNYTRLTVQKSTIGDIALRKRLCGWVGMLDGKTLGSEGGRIVEAGRRVWHESRGLDSA